MENKQENDLKIDLYPDKNPRVKIEKDVINPKKFSTNLSSLTPDVKLAYSETNVPILNGFYAAHGFHYPIRIKPDDIWLLIVQAFSYHVNNIAEKERNMFVNFEGKKTISIEYELDNIDQVDKKIVEDFAIEINKKLKTYLGNEILETLTPNFSTTTKDSEIVCKISIMSTFQKFFNYRMILCGCGVPYLILEGNAEDYKKIISKANELKKYKFDWYINRIIPLIQKMVEAKEGKIDVEHFKNIVQKVAKTIPVYRPSAIEPEYVEIDYLEGWILKFFGFYEIDQYSREYQIFDGNSIKIKDLDKLATQLLTAPFEIIDIVHKKLYKRQFKVGFVGCDINNRNEVFPVMGWCVEPENQIRRIIR